jgi:hypothetical protein
MRLLDGIRRIGRILYPNEFDTKAAVISRPAEGVKIED